jgi:hypothetical protein
MTRITSLYLQKAQINDLARLASARGYTQTRGPGTGVQPSISQFVDAIGAGELVAIGPFPRWRDVLGALDKALAVADLSDGEREALAGIRRQVEAEADFDADD